MYLRETSSFSWLHQALQGLIVHFFVWAQVSRYFSTAPMTSLYPTPCPSRPSCHCLPPEEADECCRHGAFSLLWCLSHRERLTTKNSLAPSVLKVSNIAQPFSSLASSRVLLKSTSVSSGPSRDSNSSISTLKLLLFSRYYFVFATVVLSFALHIWSTSKLSCSSSKDECEFCNGVGGLILLLDIGGGFTYGSSNHIFSCVTVQE